MNTPQVDVAQLQNRDPDAWSRLLRKVLAVDDVEVTAVTAEPLRTAKSGPYDHPVNRLTDNQLANTPFQAMVPFRPYLSGVFHRFLQSYKTL